MGGDCAYPVAAVVSGDVGGDLDVGPRLGGAVGVDHAVVGARAVAVDLVDGHLDLAAGCDLGQLGAGLRHDGPGAGLQVVLAAAQGLAHRRSVVALEPCRVLLERIPAGAVPGSRAVNTEGHAGTTAGGSSLDDGTVAGHEGNKSEYRGSLHLEKLNDYEPAQQMMDYE